MDSRILQHQLPQAEDSSPSGKNRAMSEKMPFNQDIFRRDWIVKALKGLWVEEARRCVANGLTTMPEPGSPKQRLAIEARESPILELG